MADPALYTYPSPLKGWENAPQLPDEKAEDGKSEKTFLWREALDIVLNFTVEYILRRCLLTLISRLQESSNGCIKQEL